jgi:hypothetical protein
MTGSSSAEHFDAHTANIPDVISAEEPEIIAPGQPDKPIETGWPVWDVQQIVTLPFFLLERRYGELWKIDDEESQRVASAWKPLLDKYLPLEETELGTALLVTAAILGPRILLTDWDKGKGKKPIPPANTKTAESGASPASSEKENPANQAGWAVFSEQ